MREEGVMGRLQGKSAIVTGAGSGIGRASALMFAAEGAKVLAVDRRSEGLAGTLETAKAKGVEISTRVADVSDEDDVKGYVAAALQAFGGLDVMFANAGVSGGLVPLFEQSVELWRNILAVNLLGPFLAIKHAAAAMARQGRGSIVLTASVAGLRANAGGHPYSASKAGVISLAQTAANSLAGTNVRVNAICPGLIETAMTKPLFDYAEARGTKDRIGQLNPMQRAGYPEEIAAAALFLASDESSYANGQAFVIDGGLTCSHPFSGARF
jgi:NAD(P)-dependent dehydrogenase (short-subunit alcohol dehydrogenase family)